MVMGAVTATDLNGYTGNVQLQENGVFAQIRKMAVTTSLANTDVITGPSIPAGCALVDVIVDCTDIDSATSFTFTVGISGTAAKFISTSTVGQATGIARMNVGAALGYLPTSDTPVILTVTATAGTPVAGTITIAVLCTRNP